MRVVHSVAWVFAWTTQAVGDILDWLAFDQLFERPWFDPSLEYIQRPVDTTRGNVTATTERMA